MTVGQLIAILERFDRHATVTVEDTDDTKADVRAGGLHVALIDVGYAEEAVCDCHSPSGVDCCDAGKLREQVAGMEELRKEIDLRLALWQRLRTEQGEDL